MVRLSKLPQIAVEHILRSARGRSIAGTNRYARVCRQWRNASEHAEPLQLYLNLTHLSEEDLARATCWLSMHGQHVDVLVVQEHQHYCRHCAPPPWFPGAVPALQQLKRLEVAGTDTLVGLAPVLQHLPHLQHLAATVGMCQYAEDGGVMPFWGFLSGDVPGKFTNQRLQQPLQEVPDLQQLCPQLTSLHLTIQCHVRGLEIDPRVSLLLSPRLQQLTLVTGPSCGFVVAFGLPVLSADSLVHLSALQQLTLDGVDFEQQGAGQVALGLGALQQVRVYHPHITVQGAHGTSMEVSIVSHGIVHLAPVLTEYEVSAAASSVDVLSSYGHLTRLVLSGGTLLQGTDAAVAALTGLQELGLVADLDSTAVSILQQAAGMVKLRNLQLVGFAESPAEPAACVAQCTQLTSLALLVGGPFVTPWLSALQHLPGLQRLTVCEQVLMQQQGAWLAPLTALTRLCVQLDRIAAAAAGSGTAASSSHGGSPKQQRRLGYHTKACSIWEQVKSAVPAGVQQVVFWAAHDPAVPSFAPMCWQLDVAAPGGVQVTAWLEEPDLSAAGWRRPMRPCPHLPGAWELQGRL
jgi:hypothetical protein